MSAPDQAARDRAHMRRCIELARRAEGRTSPNPMVGCVIVDARGAVMAEGHHRGPGTHHAEADALRHLAPGQARGATLYCNLEPCHHRRNRVREPCSELIARAGIARLVMGIGDPIRSHAGGGRHLAAQGVEVVRHVLRRECVELNRGFFSVARRGRPFTVLKAAMTLDGKIATRTGASQWITGKQARKHVHGVRSRLDAILVGVGTVLADDPRLTARGVRRARDPIRVVVDSRLRTPPDARLLPAESASSAQVIIATTERAPRAREARLNHAGATVWRLPAAPDGRPDLLALARRLADIGITTVLVEGGATVHGAFLDADLADELLLYTAPMVFGGPAPSWASGRGAAAIADARRFRAVDPVERLGPDLLIRMRRASS